MTIDESIVSLRKSASKSLDYEWQREQYQIAEWLEELKEYRDKNKMVIRVDCENMDSIKYNIDELSRYAENQYNKAIDDFTEKLLSAFDETNIKEYGFYPENLIRQVAKQLREGGESE